MIDVQDLSVSFATRRGVMPAVRNLSFQIQSGKTLGIVGESGSGKSVSSLALMGLLPDSAQVTAKKINFRGQSLLGLKENEWCKIRGSEIAMIFQDPISSLNPVFTVGFQLMETIRVKNPGFSRKELRNQSIALLEQVAIPDPEKRLKSYPFELSGGMCQRIVIALALAGKPKLMIADEPTTALDVTIQAQILEILKQLQKETNMAMILITHDMGVVSYCADEVLVMYAGIMAERGEANQVLTEPFHPYTEALLMSQPSRKHEFRMPLPTIKGIVPDLQNLPQGCILHPRCHRAQARCRQEVPQIQQIENHWVSCFFPGEKQK